MSALESRYRSALRWYPRSWRAQNADVVVGTLMDEADATGRQRPRPSELFSLAVHGLLSRVAVAPSASRGFRDRVAALSLGAGFALTFVMLFAYEWAPFAVDSLNPQHVGSERVGPFASAAVVVNAMWIVAFGLAVAGAVRWSRAVLAMAAGASVIAIVFINATPLLYSRPPATALVFLIGLALTGIMGRPSRRHLVVSGVAAIAVFVGFILLLFQTNSWGFAGRLYEGWAIASSGWWPLLLFALALGCVFVKRAWVTPLMAFAVLWAVFTTAFAYSERSRFDDLLWGVLAIASGSLLVAAVSLGARGYRLQFVKAR